MNDQTPLIRNISDTALWVAHYRADENDRPDRVFDDPFARSLAGKRGQEIAGSTKFLKGVAWPFIARTWLIDKIVTEHVQQGFDTVINLAAGLDTRPYRMALPPTLQWIEVDLPDILRYKEEILQNEKPRCQLERVALDLSDRSRRDELFKRLGSQARKALVITEGLLIYLKQEQVIQLAEDLAAQPGIQRWVTDLSSPGLLEMMNRKMGSALSSANAPFQFAPEEGPLFFEKYHWKKVEVHSMLKTARTLNRLPFMLKVMSFLVGGKKPNPRSPWSGVCLFGREN
ncbi:MAG TPA: SAM-dependent methyltransferase [Gemmatales bacterium]|nr:SAM-dependent methyltransferase [Gemmatales bacterium]